MQVSSIKRVAVIVAVALTYTLLWAASKPWLESPFRFSGYADIIWPSVALIVATAVAGLAWMMLERRIERIAATLVSWATFTVFWSPNIWYLTILPIFMLLWFESARRIRNDLGDRHKLRITTTVGSGLTPLLLGTFLMLSLGFYLLPAYRTVDAEDISIGIQDIVEGTYDNPLVVDQFAQMPPAMRAEVKSELARNVDIYVRRYLGPLGAYLPPILAFGLFLVLWSVLFIFREVSIWMGAFLFWVLRKSGFVRIEEKDVKAQVLVL